jgi:hypothetical protein
MKDVFTEVDIFRSLRISAIQRKERMGIKICHLGNGTIKFNPI